VLVMAAHARSDRPAAGRPGAGGPPGRLG
jgi:hypothetical protein